MKNNLFALLMTLSLISGTSHALEFKLNHPCDQKLTINREIILNETESALNITLAQLKSHKISYQLIEGGIKSIFEFAENKNLEIIDPKNFIAYGWCYTVNGQFPEQMPDQYHLVNSDSLNWFLGSSQYSDGQWVSYCQPVHIQESSNYCKE